MSTNSPRWALLLPVYLPSALLALAQGLLLPTLPVYARDFDVSFGMAALVIAAAGVGTMIADVPAGMVLSRLGLKMSMLLGTGMTAAAMFALGLAQVFPELIIYQLACGVGRAMWSLSRHAYITEIIPPRERGRSISVFGGLNRIGMFGGPAIGGLVGTQFGLTSAFYLGGFLALIAFGISLFFVRDPEIVPEGTRSARWGIVFDLVRTNGRDLGAASIAQLCGQMIRAGRQAIIPFFGDAVLGLSVAEIGTIQSASSMVDMALFFPAGYIMDRFGRKVASVPSFAVMAIGMGLIPLTTGFFSLLVVATIIGFGNGLGSGAMMTLGADLAPRRAMGEFLGVWRFIGDSGRAGGPVVVGSLADATGFGVTSVVIAAFGLGASLTLALLVQETRDSYRTAESESPT